MSARILRISWQSKISTTFKKKLEESCQQSSRTLSRNSKNLKREGRWGREKRSDNNRNKKERERGGEKLIRMVNFIDGGDWW